LTTAIRLLRILGIAVAFFVIFNLSQHATEAREGTTLPGISWAIGVISVLLLISAVTAERYQGDVPVLRRDLLWGLGTGGIAIVLSRF
jgi:hypothetical protein